MVSSSTGYAKGVRVALGKIMVDTEKSDLSAAKAYGESVLETLQTRFVSTGSIIFLVVCVFVASVSWVFVFWGLFFGWWTPSQTFFVAGTCLSGYKRLASE